MYIIQIYNIAYLYLKKKRMGEDKEEEEEEGDGEAPASDPGNSKVCRLGGRVRP